MRVDKEQIIILNSSAQAIVNSDQESVEKDLGCLNTVLWESNSRSTFEA